MQRLSGHTLNKKHTFLYITVGGGNGRISLPGTRREQAKRQLCLGVLTAAIPTPHAICRTVDLIMKVNLSNTKL